MNSFYAYKPFTHQHVPEIEQELKRVGEWNSELVFMTHSLPVARVIFASIYVETPTEIAEAELNDTFRRFFADSPVAAAASFRLTASAYGYGESAEVPQGGSRTPAPGSRLPDPG